MKLARPFKEAVHSAIAICFKLQAIGGKSIVERDFRAVPEQIYYPCCELFYFGERWRIWLLFRGSTSLSAQNKSGLFRGRFCISMSSRSGYQLRIMPALRSSIAVVLWTPSSVAMSWKLLPTLTDTVEPSAPSETFTTSPILPNFWCFRSSCRFS